MVLSVVTHKWHWHDKYKEIYKAVQAKDTHLDIETPGIASGPATFEVGVKVCTTIQNPGEKSIYHPEERKAY